MKPKLSFTQEGKKTKTEKYKQCKKWKNERKEKIGSQDTLIGLIPLSATYPFSAPRKSCY